MLKGIPSPKIASSADLQLTTNKMKVAVTRSTRDLRYAWASEQYAEWLSSSSRNNHRQQNSRRAWERSVPKTTVPDDAAVVESLLELGGCS